MPTIKIINATQVPLHIALTQVGPLHWQNDVEPQGTAVLKPGPVFFTIEARIARGADNEYDRLQCFVPIAIVTVSVVTLGVGAVYFSAAAAAAGSASAVMANISAQVASKVPAIRKLYKYARRSQQIARIGNIVGVGGSMLASKKLADADAAAISSKTASQSEGRFSGFWSKKEDKLSKKEEKKQAAESMKILQGLVAGSVVSSPGWYLNRDRTLRIEGGPRATEVDGLLVIETDTVVPFTIVEEHGKTLAKGKSQQELLQAGEQAQLAAVAAAAQSEDTQEGSTLKPPDMRRTKSTPDHSALAAAADTTTLPHPDSDSDSDSDKAGGDTPATAADTVKGKFAEWSSSISGMTDEALQRGATMYSRFRPGAGAKPSDTPATATLDSKGTVEKPSVASEAEQKTTPKEDSAPSTTTTDTVTDDDDPAPLDALLQMGFSPLEAHDALRRKEGKLQAAIEDLLAKDGAQVQQLAMSTPLPASPPVYGEPQHSPLVLSEEKKPKALEGGAVSVESASGQAKSTDEALATTPSAPETASSTPATVPPPVQKKPLKVVGGESIENPHWTQKARQAVETATSSELGKLAASQVLGRSKAFLGAGEGKSASSSSSSSKAKGASSGWGLLGSSSSSSSSKGKADTGSVKRSKSVAGETSRRT
ncbi:hypothetical protein A4X13_0g4215 [Tilletia indica]|uniref:Uncharacterized protein n=1 Tax=Tilletia indica TaxID=43049 RepID=A0A177TPA5_9BASI|nr:hypothetical protein A4X13_0g4215 [Tilletia indica]